MKDHDDLAAVLRSVDLRLLPALYCLALVLALDGTNIGVASIEGMLKDLHMHEQDINVAVQVFYIPCILFAVPANLVLLASRPRFFLGGVVFLTGVVTILHALTESFVGLVACRILLGACETSFFAGAVYLTSSYYPLYALHSRMSPLIACRLISNACGSLLAFAIAHLDGVAGLGAWRWIYLIEGILTSAAAAVGFFIIPPWPEQASFLHPSGQKVLVEALQRQHNTVSGINGTRRAILEAIRDPKVYFTALIHLCCAVTIASTAVFLPAIMKDFGWTSSKAEYMAVPIFLFAAVVSIAVGFASDYTNRRYLFCVGLLLPVVIALGILLASPQLSVGARYAACFLLSSGSVAAMSVSITWLSNNIDGRQVRGIALGFVAAMGNCGSIIGSNVYLRSESPYYPTGFGVCLALTILAFVAATMQLVYLKRYRTKTKANVVI